MDSAANELEAHTLRYWYISQCRNGRSDAEIETGSAIHTLSDAIYGMNPSRPLVKAAFNLQSLIIEDLPFSKRATGQNLLSFEELAKIKAE